MEFKRSLSLIREDSGQLTACSVEPALRTPVHMLNSIKAYCSENQRHSIDSLLNCLQIIQMLQMFQGPGTSDSSGAASAADSMDYLKGMLSPEQQQMFQQFSETVQKENSPGGDRHGE